MRFPYLSDRAQLADTVGRATTAFRAWMSAIEKRNAVTPTTVAALADPAKVDVGQPALVTDANLTTFAAIVVGGGTKTVPVYCDGTNWRIG